MVGTMRATVSTPAGLGFTPFAEKSQANPRLADVVQWMIKFAHKGKTEQPIRALAVEICKDVTPGDYASEAYALYAWVCANIRYMRDPSDVEWVQDPIRTVQARAGDCDDTACLLAALLMACGNTCSFVIASFSNPPGPSHVFVQVDTPLGPVPLDTVANRETERMTRTMTGTLVIPLGGEANHGAGVGAAKGAAARDGTYSVYSYDDRAFQYYQAPLQGPGKASGWFRNPTGNRRKPECLVVPLPAGARLVGSGRVPKGTMATVSSPGVPGAGLGAVFAEGAEWQLAGYALAVALGYLIWKSK